MRRSRQGLILALLLYLISFALPAISIVVWEGPETYFGWRCAWIAPLIAVLCVRTPLCFPFFVVLTLSNLVMIWSILRYVILRKPATFLGSSLATIACVFAWLPLFAPGVLG